ncbi:MAG: hypothetical protein HY308_11090 [Gammaproteobacteria bacterium]|nr:hypothetical protein [Gammaproteobacteria bacterium]
MTVYLLDTVTNDTKLGKLVFAHEIKPDDDSHQFKGQSKKDNWKPLQFSWRLKPNQKRQNLTINDFVLVFGAGNYIALNEKAKTVLEPALDGDAEYLPIEIKDEQSDRWYLINVIHRLDNVVDYEKSHYMDLVDGSRILQRPVFIERNIPNDRVFVYPNTYNRPIAKGEFLKELVAAHKLTGLNFLPAETVEAGPLPKSAAG